MDQLIECVPNFSEGVNMDIIHRITAEVEAVDGVKLLNVDPGKGTNRTGLGWAESSAYAGSAAEADFVRSMLAASLGRNSSEVSDLSVMLFAPLVRGTEVTLR